MASGCSACLTGFQLILDFRLRQTFDVIFKRKIKVVVDVRKRANERSFHFKVPFRARAALELLWSDEKGSVLSWTTLSQRLVNAFSRRLSKEKVPKHNKTEQNGALCVMENYFLKRANESEGERERFYLCRFHVCLSIKQVFPCPPTTHNGFARFRSLLSFGWG